MERNAPHVSIAIDVCARVVGFVSIVFRISLSILPFPSQQSDLRTGIVQVVKRTLLRFVCRTIVFGGKETVGWHMVRAVVFRIRGRSKRADVQHPFPRRRHVLWTVSTGRVHPTSYTTAMVHLSLHRSSSTRPWHLRGSSPCSCPMQHSFVATCPRR